MSPPSLADYLAKNYLTADAPSSSTSSKSRSGKKRKRKDGISGGGGLVIADDDATGWDKQRHGNNNENDNDDDDTIPITASAHRTAEFRKSRTSNWKTLTGESIKPGTMPSTMTSRSRQKPDDDSAAADAIIASAAEEARAKSTGTDADDAPALVEGADPDSDDPDQPRMESGARAGLQSAAELTAQLKRARMREDAALATANMDAEANGPGETIYRDASGRIVNLALKRAEARAQAEAAARKEREEREDAMGDVQKREAERRREELKEARHLTVARYADDEDLNRELRERERWNDPAAGFLENKKKRESKGGGGGGGGGGAGGGKPAYKGHAAPNRYGIRPGYRWDGVDRSNGFESEYFAARARRQNVENLKYAWQMDE